MTTLTTTTPQLDRIARALDAHPDLTTEDRAHLFACLGAAHGPVLHRHWEAVRRALTCRGRTLRVAALFHNVDLPAGKVPTPRQILTALEKEAPE